MARITIYDDQQKERRGADIREAISPNTVTLMLGWRIRFFNPPSIKSALQLECRTPTGVRGGPPPIDGPLPMSLGRHIYLL